MRIYADKSPLGLLRGTGSRNPGAMKQASLSDLRRNLSSMLNAVNSDHEPLVVTRKWGKPVVMMSLDDYRALDRKAASMPRPETAHNLWKALSEVDEITFLPANDD